MTASQRWPEAACGTRQCQCVALLPLRIFTLCSLRTNLHTRRLAAYRMTSDGVVYQAGRSTRRRGAQLLEGGREAHHYTDAYRCLGRPLLSRVSLRGGGGSRSLSVEDCAVTAVMLRLDAYVFTLLAGAQTALMHSPPCAVMSSAPI